MAFNDPDGAGVGGWLAFFVLAMAAFTPLAMVVSTYAGLYGDPGVSLAYPDSWGTIQVFEWTLAAIVVAGCWFIAWRLNYVQVWQTVRITIAGMWILTVGSMLADLVGVALITGIPFAALIGASLGPEMARPLIFSTIWTAYFLRSKRVANTYPRDSDPNQVAEVFG
jgi:Protein of unknown function (DUF2569)